MPTPEVGQLWADTDKREVGRTVRIVKVDGPHTYIETVTYRDGTPAPKRKPIRVLTYRFDSGFRLIEGDPR